MEGMINKFLDNRRNNSFSKLLNTIDVNVVSINHFVVDSTEYDLIKNQIENQ